MLSICIGTLPRAIVCLQSRIRVKAAVVELRQSALFDAFAQCPFYIALHIHIFSGGESECFSSFCSPARTADSMRVCVNRVRHIEVNHMGDVGYVDTARGDVRSHEDVIFAITKTIDRLLPLVLRHIALQRGDAMPFLFKIAGQETGAPSWCA